MSSDWEENPNLQQFKTHWCDGKIEGVEAHLFTKVQYS